MKNNIFKQTDIDSNASFKATTVYCETTYIISGHFEDGKVVITDERPFPNITQEQINDLPQYYLFMDSKINRQVNKIGFRERAKDVSLNHSESFTEIYEVENTGFYKSRNF